MAAPYIAIPFNREVIIVIATTSKAFSLAIACHAK